MIDFVRGGRFIPRVIQTECVTDQQVMGLETVHLRNLVTVYPEVDQGSLGKQGQHHRGCRGRCCTFVPWDLLGMGEQVQSDLALDNAGHQ